MSSQVLIRLLRKIHIGLKDHSPIFSYLRNYSCRCSYSTIILAVFIAELTTARLWQPVPSIYYEAAFVDALTVYFSSSLFLWALNCYIAVIG